MDRAPQLPASLVDWTGRKGSDDDERLRAALLDAERRALKTLGTASGAHPCHRCLGLALTECRAERYFAAWDNLHQFDLELLAELDEEGRRLARVGLVAEAAVKLVGWRRSTVTSLEAMPDEQGAPSVQWLGLVRMHLATQAQNVWIKRRILGARVLPTLLASLATIVAFLVAGWNGAFDVLLGGKPMATPLLLGVAAGTLGGMISVATSIMTADPNARIPDVRQAAMLTGLRPTVGALCAIPVVFLVHSEFVSFKGLSLMWTSVVLCLATGFSERWLLGLMENLTAKAKP